MQNTCETLVKKPCYTLPLVTVSVKWVSNQRTKLILKHPSEFYNMLQCISTPLVLGRTLLSSHLVNQCCCTSIV